MNPSKKTRCPDALSRARKPSSGNKTLKSPAAPLATVRRASLLKNNKSLAVKLQEARSELSTYKTLFEESRKFITQTKLVKSQMVQLSTTFKDFVKTLDENLLLLEFDESDWINIKSSAQSRKSIRKEKNPVFKALDKVAEETICQKSNEEERSFSEAGDVTAKAGGSNFPQEKCVPVKEGVLEENTSVSDAIIKATKIPKCKTLRVNLKRHVFDKEFERENKICKLKSPEKTSKESDPLLNRRKTFVINTRNEFESDNVNGKEIASGDEFNLDETQQGAKNKPPFKNSRKTFVKKKNNFSDDCHPTVSLDKCPNEGVASVTDAELMLSNKLETCAVKGNNVVTNPQSIIDLNDCPYEEVAVENSERSTSVLKNTKRKTFVKNRNDLTDVQPSNLNDCPVKEVAVDNELYAERSISVSDGVIGLKNNKRKTFVKNRNDLTDVQSTDLISCPDKEPANAKTCVPDVMALKNNRLTIVAEKNGDVLADSQSVPLNNCQDKLVKDGSTPIPDDVFVLKNNKLTSVAGNDPTDSQSTNLNNCLGENFVHKSTHITNVELVSKDSEQEAVAKKCSSSLSINLNKSPGEKISVKSNKSILCQNNEHISDGQKLSPNKELDTVNLNLVPEVPKNGCQSENLKITSPQCNMNGLEKNCAVVENSETVEPVSSVIPLSMPMPTETVSKEMSNDEQLDSENNVEEMCDNLMSLNFDIINTEEFDASRKEVICAEDLREDEKSYIEFLNIMDIVSETNPNEQEKVFEESSESDCELISDDEVSFIGEERPMKTTPVRRHISNKKKKMFVFDGNKKNVLKERSVSKIKVSKSPENRTKQKKTVLKEKSPHKIKDSEIEEKPSEKNANKKNQHQKKTVLKEKSVSKTKDPEINEKHLGQITNKKNQNQKKTIVKKKPLSKIKASESGKDYPEKNAKICSSNSDDDIGDNRTDADEVNKNAAHFSSDELENKNSCDEAQVDSCKIKAKNPQTSSGRARSNQGKNKRNPPKDAICDDLLPAQKKAKKRTRKKKEDVYFDDDAISKFTEDDSHAAAKVARCKEIAKDAESDSACRKTGENTFLVRAEIHPLPSSVSVEDLNKENVKLNLTQVTVVLDDVLKSKDINFLSSCDRDLLYKTHLESSRPADAEEESEATGCGGVLNAENVKSRRRKEVNYKEPSLTRKMRRC